MIPKVIYQGFVSKKKRPCRNDRASFLIRDKEYVLKLNYLLDQKSQIR
jgi:hypothetical protein